MALGIPVVPVVNVSRAGWLASVIGIGSAVIELSRRCHKGIKPVLM